MLGRDPADGGWAAERTAIFRTGRSGRLTESPAICICSLLSGYIRLPNSAACGPGTALRSERSRAVATISPRQFSVTKSRLLMGRAAPAALRGKQLNGLLKVLFAHGFRWRRLPIAHLCLVRRHGAATAPSCLPWKTPVTIVRNDRDRLSGTESRWEMLADAGDMDRTYDIFDASRLFVRYEQQSGASLTVRKQVMAWRGAIASPSVRRPGSGLTPEAMAEVNRPVARQDKRLKEISR